MFSDFVNLRLIRATLKLVTDDRQVQHRVAECTLQADPFTRELASQLRPAIATHLFAGARVREEVQAASFDLDAEQQLAKVYQAPDAEAPTATLRHVDIQGLTVTLKPDADYPTFRGQFRIRFGLAEKVHRDFLARNFGASLFWVFEEEQHPLPLEGPAPEPIAVDQERVDQVVALIRTHKGTTKAHNGSVEFEDGKRQQSIRVPKRIAAQIQRIRAQGGVDDIAVLVALKLSERDDD